jgi:hypothetical protein
MKIPRYRLPIRLFNLTGWRTKLEEGALIDAAVRKTGLRDFGDESWRPALRRLLVSLDQEARLHPWGRFITRQRLLGLLKNRLRAQALFRKHPEILEQELEPLLVITGLQRTGTTLLQRLLSADPDAYSLLSWEALNPAPLDRKHEQKKRIALARSAERVLRYMAPEFFAIHPVDHKAQEEEILLLDMAFLSTVPEATMLVPEYSAWLERQDQEPAYRTMKKMLLLLQWQKGQGRTHWVLKSPHHMEWLDVLVRVFPDTRIIHTHRDPLRNLASFLRMAFHAMHIFSEAVTPEEVGAFWTAKIARMVERAMAFRAAGGAGRITDVSYYDLVREPMREIERIRADAAFALTDEARRCMKEQREANRPHKHGVHHYRLEDFGVERPRAEARFAEYRAQFQLPHEDDSHGEQAIPQHFGVHPRRHQTAVREEEAHRQPD